MANYGTDFEDMDYASPKPKPAGNPALAGRAPSREDLDAELTGTQQRLAEIRETQEQLERTRAAIEEMRRRRAEFAQGRTEMLQSLTHGVALLEKAEHDARTDAEQMARSLAGLREALAGVEQLHEQAWTNATWEQELSRALATIDNARNEYLGARRKWPLLDGKDPRLAASPAPARTPALHELPISQLCRIGLALTWPVALVTLAALGLFVFLLLRR